MKKTRHAWWLMAALLLAGCNQEDTKAITRIGKKVQARAESVTGEVKNNTASSWHLFTDLGLEVRVATRLRWDKELDGAAIEVVHLGTGVELKGSVRSFEQHRRAVMLAESTTGVDGVKDSLVESER